MTRHLAKLLDAVWYVSMGLFLGLTGGLVLSVILTFRGAREIDATPGVEPYNDPKFVEYHNDAVAGYIGQDLFGNGIAIGLVLLALAAVSRLATWIIARKQPSLCSGSQIAGTVQLVLVLTCLMVMTSGMSITNSMNRLWPKLYDTQAQGSELEERRAYFDNAHQWSSRVVGSAWFCGFVALTLTPWCRRVADTHDQGVKKPQQQ